MEENKATNKQIQYIKQLIDILHPHGGGYGEELNYPKFMDQWSKEYASEVIKELEYGARFDSVHYSYMEW